MNALIRLNESVELWRGEIVQSWRSDSDWSSLASWTRQAVATIKLCNEQIHFRRTNSEFKLKQVKTLSFDSQRQSRLIFECKSFDAPSACLGANHCPFAPFEPLSLCCMLIQQGYLKTSTLENEMNEKYVSMHSPLIVSEEISARLLWRIIIYFHIWSNHSDSAPWLCRQPESKHTLRWIHRTLLPEFSPHTKMLGYFPTKLMLNFELNLDIYHHE